MKHCCEELSEHISNEELGIVFWAKFREYGMRYLDGGSSIQQIRYCPWCGQKLPGSLRDRWFDRIEQMGYELGDPRIPEIFLSGKWYES